MSVEIQRKLGEILKRREKDAEYREVLESIRKDVLRINRIVGNLLSFSRSGAASSGWIALHEVIDVALELFQVVIGRQHIDVRRSYAAGLPPVWGNAQDLQQVFINLIANAVDAMPAGARSRSWSRRTRVPPPAEPAARGRATMPANWRPRALMDVPGWEVRFSRRRGEIDCSPESGDPPSCCCWTSRTPTDRVISL
jgi:hypothetical protein